MGKDERELDDLWFDASPIPIDRDEEMDRQDVEQSGLTYTQSRI